MTIEREAMRMIRRAGTMTHRAKRMMSQARVVMRLLVTANRVGEVGSIGAW